MLSLLNASNWFAQYGLLIVLVAALVVLMLISFNRRRKEDAYKNDLNQKVVPGAMIKTYYGLYGKVIKITETTDGKILLIETGEGKNTSYQTLHINAVYGIDEKKDVVYDESGNEIVEGEKTDETKKFEELEKKLDDAETKNKKSVKNDKTEDKVANAEVVEPKKIEEPKKEDKKAAEPKSTATKKSKTTKTEITK